MFLLVATIPPYEQGNKYWRQDKIRLPINRKLTATNHGTYFSHMETVYCSLTTKQHNTILRS